MEVYLRGQLYICRHALTILTLAQGHLRGGNEGGVKAAFPHSPPIFILLNWSMDTCCLPVRTSQSVLQNCYVSNADMATQDLEQSSHLS